MHNDPLVLGILSSIIAALIIALCTYVYRRLFSGNNNIIEMFILGYRASKAGISNIYRNRSDYAKYRNAVTLADYITNASSEIYIIGLWIAHTSETENIISKFKEMILSNDSLRIYISLIDPNSEMMHALAQYLNLDNIETITRVNISINKLKELQRELLSMNNDRLELRLYNSLATISYILIDPKMKCCKVQIDIKLFHKARQDSVSFEFKGNDKQLTKTMIESAMLWYNHSKVIRM